MTTTTDRSLAHLPEMLSIQEAAAILGVTPWQAYKMAQSGELSAAYAGRRIVIHPADVRDVIERQAGVGGSLSERLEAARAEVSA